MSQPLSYKALLEIDRQHIWHPYSAMPSDVPVFPVVRAQGVRLVLADGRELIDGMSSWWCTIHGYNHPVLNQAIIDQTSNMAHVMFGGLTHPAAVKLAKKLVDITDDSLQSVFFADSGSVSIEVSMKMAIQYWQAKGQSKKQKMLTIRGGYHGDTLGAMSVCDPETGMHSLFTDVLAQHYFVDAPTSAFGEAVKDSDIQAIDSVLADNAQNIAAVILEPIVQGTGGMRFYSADYLNAVRVLCDRYNVLLIFDEIATGFGRTGKLFAYEHTQVVPDILCLGKSLTAGYMTLSAVLTNKVISDTISQSAVGAFMHGPTFMANPLACAVALANIELLLDSDWQQRVQQIEQQLIAGLEECRAYEQVADVRVLGAIGVVELTHAVDMASIQQAFVDAGVWIRPFGRLVYIMPAFIIDAEDLQTLMQGMRQVIAQSV